MATITSPRSESPAVPVPRITSPSIPSTSGTPSSSVRPSVDLPRNTNNTTVTSPVIPQNASASPAPAPSQRRNRAALRDYYNLKSKAPPGGGQEQTDSRRTASVASVTSDSTVTSSAAVPPDSSSLTDQLDDPSFDAEAYVSEMLKGASLRDILRMESTLVGEIRNLDGERKALVYDNYSKLIKAVGTIAEMQKGMHRRDPGRDRFGGVLLGGNGNQSPGLDGVEKLGEKLDALLTVLKELGPHGQDALTTQAASSTGHKNKRRQKQTVRWALDAPSRLALMVRQGRNEEAEREFAAVVDLLDQWKGVAGVVELRSWCEKAMDRRPARDADPSEVDDSG